MSIFQLISILFALCMMYIVNIHRRKHALSPNEVLFWYLIWAGFILAALFPETLLGVAERLRFARTFDFLVVVAMMILTTVVIISYFSQKDSAKKLEEYVRDEAMRDANK